MIKLKESSVKFYIGAATRGEGDHKWSFPGRDLEFLYMRAWANNRDCSVEPSLDVWKQFGVMMVEMGEDSSLVRCSVKEFAARFGDAYTLELLRKSPGIYLKESKDQALDYLRCPR